MRTLLLIATIFLALFAFAQQPQTYTLTIHVTGFRNAKGVLGATIFNNPSGWPEDNGKALMHNHVDIQNNEATIKFQLPAGTYSVAVLHDENRNQHLDRNFLGIPKEGFGFSNNIKANLSAPAWQKCNFTLNGDKTLDITLQYK